MKPEVQLLGISIKTFGVTFALGFVACGLVVARRLREMDRPVDWAYEITFAALIGGVIGARVYYLIENSSSLHGSVLGNIFSGSGLVWYGGAIGGAIGVIGWMRWRHVLELRMLDMCATAPRPGLRDRPHRLPGLRRRRLRHPLDAADRDGLPARHRPHASGRDGAADADLRDGCDVPAGLRPVAAARPCPARA